MALLVNYAHPSPPTHHLASSPTDLHLADPATPLCQTSCRLKKYKFEGRRQQWKNVIQKHLLSRR